MTRPIIEVCAAIVRRDGAVLLATRPTGAHLSGKWEFPGGKVHEGESLGECIRRELEEELGLQISSPRKVASICHDYPEKRVLLHFMQCELPGDVKPVCREGQAARWVHPDELETIDLAPADRAFLSKHGI